MIAKLGDIRNAWTLRFDAKPLGTIIDFGALILLTMTGFPTNACGDRNPGLFLSSSSSVIMACTCTSSDWNSCFYGPSPPSDVYTTIEAIQFPSGGSGAYKFNLLVNGTVTIDVDITGIPASLSDVKLYVYQTWYHMMANANIKNIVFYEIK